MLATVFPLSKLHAGLGNGLLPLAQSTAGSAASAAGAQALPNVGRFFTADDVLAPYVWVFYTAFIVSYFLTPVMQAVALYYGIIDQPDKLRKMHSRPVAYLGGVSVFLGWIAGLAVSQFLTVHGSEPSPQQHLYVNFSIVVGASVIVGLGLWDDLQGVQPWAKIFGQLFAATFLLLFGIGTHCASPLFQPLNARLVRFGMHVPDEVVTLVSCAIVYFVVVGCCNATNLMDGLDGLCGGVTAVIAAGFLFLAVNIARTSGGLNINLDGVRVILGLALLGGVLGFIPFNFNPASIFMGDTGSMFLGFACATMIILAAQETHPKWFLASLVMFALPVLDTALAFARRYVNRRPIFSADKHHFHHQMVARGFSVKQTVLISYGLALFFALAGGAVVVMRTRYAVGFYLVIFGSLIVTAYKMGMVHEKTRVVTRQPLGGGFETVVTAATDVEPDKVIEIREAPRG
jgi:UDP-GlcNAc:undecaprenyl-phosphate/decaprenyl-phosphate GlcNAc-1-phosphate transferase